jgi:hypothetical protein
VNFECCSVLHLIFHDVRISKDDHTFENKFVIRRLPWQTRWFARSSPLLSQTPHQPSVPNLKQRIWRLNYNPLSFLCAYSEDTAMVKKNQKEIWPYFCLIFFKSNPNFLTCSRSVTVTSTKNIYNAKRSQNKRTKCISIWPELNTPNFDILISVD